MPWSYETFRSAGRLVCIVFLAHFADLEPAVMEFAAPGARKLRERGDAWSLYCGAARDPKCARDMIYKHTWTYGDKGWRDLAHGDANVFSVVFKVSDLGDLEQDAEIRDVKEKGAEQTFRVLIERLFPQFEPNNINICGASVFRDEDGSCCYYVCFAARAAKCYPRDLRLAGGWEGAGTGAASWTAEETADLVAALEETQIDIGTSLKKEGWKLVSEAAFSRPDGGQSRDEDACKMYVYGNLAKFREVLPEGHWAVSDWSARVDVVVATPAALGEVPAPGKDDPEPTAKVTKAREKASVALISYAEFYAIIGPDAVEGAMALARSANDAVPLKHDAPTCLAQLATATDVVITGAIPGMEPRRLDAALQSAGATVSYAPTESTTLVVRGDVRGTNAMRDKSNKEWDAKERGVPIIGAGTVVAWLREGHHL